MRHKKETTLLDSSLNTGQFLSSYALPSYKKYNIKVLDCKDYKQIYLFENDKYYKYKDIENNLTRLDYDKNIIFSDKSIKKSKKGKKIIDNEILFKNVMRSKLQLQRLAKANANEWKTFITLTFKDNITDLSKAYTRFRYFIRSIDRVMNDFKWLCVPEFQKSGRVHYHLVTNIDLNDKNIISTQEFNGEIYYHTKQWQKNGFDCVETVKDKDGNDTKKLCGYISKYMTKSYIEDCFYNKNRYYSSQNLNRPREYYLDLSKEEDLAKYNELIESTEMIYNNQYLDKMNNTISFIEFKTK